MSSSTPLISIVTVCRDDVDGLRRTLDSIANQTVNPTVFEVLVIDGASTDGSQLLAESYCRPGWQVISESDRGIYDGMNKGWRRSGGNFVQFLNSGDAFLDPSALSRVVDALERAKDGYDWLLADGLHLHGGRRQPSPVGGVPYVWWRHAFGLQPVCHQAGFFGRDLLLALGGYSERFGPIDDFDLIVRAGLLRAPIELHSLVVAYAGGGMTARLARELPFLQHQVRVDRMRIGGIMARLDRTFVAYRSLRARIHRIRAGAISKLKGTYSYGRSRLSHDGSAGSTSRSS